jgi:hypothetical protein
VPLSVPDRVRLSVPEAVLVGVKVGVAEGVGVAVGEFEGVREGVGDTLGVEEGENRPAAYCAEDALREPPPRRRGEPVPEPVEHPYTYLLFRGPDEAGGYVPLRALRSTWRCAISWASARDCRSWSCSVASRRCCRLR